jgi:hypothetical protein
VLDHLRAPCPHPASPSAALTSRLRWGAGGVGDELRRRREMVVGAEEEADRLLEDVLVSIGEQFFFARMRVERWREHLAAERRWLDRALASLDDAGRQPEPREAPEPPTRSEVPQHPTSVEEPTGSRRVTHRPGWPRTAKRDGGRG